MFQRERSLAMEDKDRLEGFGQHGERLRVESEVFGHAPGYASVGLRAVYAFRGACMHPYASGDAYMPVLRFGLFPAFRGGLHACMHCMHHSLIEDSGKGRKPLILMHTMHTRERNYVFSFIYKGFRAFSGLFLYASPDAYRCIHRGENNTLRYDFGGRALQYRKAGEPTPILQGIVRRNERNPAHG